MGFEPSLHCLYRRSRYSRSEGEPATGSRQHRRELFAVAAVAFVLKHDETFRARFFREICGFAASAGRAMPRIEVQPHDHSDLAIKDEVAASLFVVEFKVGAELEEKQNPRHDKAFFGNGGYGKLILEERGYRNFARKSYIVLDDFKGFDDGERQGLTFKARTWADLGGDGEQVGALWADLLDSLGELGVTAFQFQKLRNMNNAQHTKEAVAMHQTLSSVASRLKFGNSGGEDINWEGDEAWYGRNIPNRRLRGFINLEIDVKAEGDVMGWFGYQSGPGHCERAVWFYCGSEQAAKRTQTFILECVRNGPPGKSGIKGTDVWFQSDSYVGVGDAEWFDAVFKVLADKKTAQAK